MIIVHSDDLKEFLNEELKSRCNADPQSLTKYILALLKKKRSSRELQNVLVDSLDVFLSKQTIPFVEMLLEALKTESYVKKNIKEKDKPPEVKKNKLPTVSGEVNKNLTHTHAEKENDVRDPTVREPERARPHNTFPNSMNQRLERCKDYDTRGFCLAGNSCMYFHGVDAVVIEDIIPPLPTQSFPLPPLPPTEPPVVYPTRKQIYPCNPVPEPYNPEHPGIESAPSYFPSPSLSYYDSYNIKDTHRKRERELVLLSSPSVNNTISRGREEKAPVNVKRKAFDFNRLGPPKFLKTETASLSNTLQLKNVPNHLNTIINLNALFSKFGTIKNIEILSDTSASIKFEKTSEAEDCFKNIKVNFDIVYLDKEKEKEPVFSVEKEELYKKVVKKKELRSVFVPKPVPYPNNSSKKKLELIKKKQLLLSARIKYYKIIVAKLSAKKKNKEREKEFEFLRETLKTVSADILSMKTEIERETMDLKKKISLSAGKKPMFMERESEKALLDAEMDFYNSSSLLNSKNLVKGGKEPSNKKKELLFEVDELKEKAKLLGLFEQIPQSNSSQPEPSSQEKVESDSLSAEVNLVTNSNQEEQQSTEQSDFSKPDSILLGEDEEEDEEEDSEARSWRR